MGRYGDDISDRPTIFLIDYGLSSSYIDAEGVHIRNPKPVRNAAKTGTARYASLNVHKGKAHSRRDDMESLTYVLIELLKGYKLLHIYLLQLNFCFIRNLPWSGVKAVSSIDGWRKIGIQKDDIVIAELTEGLPPEIGALLESMRELKFAQEPDYPGWIRAFAEALMRHDEELGKQINSSSSDIKNISLTWDDDIGGLGGYQ